MRKRKLLTFGTFYRVFAVRTRVVFPAGVIVPHEIGMSGCVCNRLCLVALRVTQDIFGDKIRISVAVAGFTQDDLKRRFGDLWYSAVDTGRQSCFLLRVCYIFGDDIC